MEKSIIKELYYDAPTVEVVEIAVEAGFATSGSGEDMGINPWD